MSKLFNLAEMTTATTGTGTVTLGSATSGRITFAAAGAVNGDIVKYGIRDGTASEVGVGTYSSTGPTLTRTLRNSTTGSLLNLSGSAEVFITDLNDDHLPDDPLSIPGAFRLVKNASDAPVWARLGRYTEQSGWYGGLVNGTGAGRYPERISVDGYGDTLATGNTSTGAATSLLASDSSAVFQPGTLMQCLMRAPSVLSDGTNDYRLIFGGTYDYAFGSIGPEAIQFEYDLAAAGNHNWRARTRSSSTNTFTDTGVAVVVNTPFRLAISYDSTSQVRFFINDALVATHTTNIPNASVSDVPISASIKKTAGVLDREIRVTQALWSRFF
jgi:hypothetical protein